MATLLLLGCQGDKEELKRQMIEITNLKEKLQKVEYKNDSTFEKIRDLEDSLYKVEAKYQQKVQEVAFVLEHNNSLDTMNYLAFPLKIKKYIFNKDKNNHVTVDLSVENLSNDVISNFEIKLSSFNFYLKDLVGGTESQVGKSAKDWTEIIPVKETISPHEKSKNITVSLKKIKDFDALESGNPVVGIYSLKTLEGKKRYALIGMK